MKPRLLFVGRARIPFPLDETRRRRYESLTATLEWRQLGTLAGGVNDDPRFVLARPFPVARLDGVVFYAALPVRVATELRRFRPEAVLVQGAQETALVLLARRLARVETIVILDVHGDWRTPTRLYGSPLRRLLSPLADALARFALHHADAVRTITSYTSELVRAEGVEPVAEFPAYMDLEPFTGPTSPLPERSVALFIGVLERYKAIDVLADAWRRAAPQVPDAMLHIVGKGSMSQVVEELVRDLPGQTRWTEALPTEGVAAALDEATVLTLPSRSEGMGRVIVEAFCRGRAVVGSRVGGIPDLVVDGANGKLIRPGDAQDLGAALVAVLGNPALAQQIGDGAAASAATWVTSPAQFAERMRDLVDRSVTRRRA